MPVSLKNMSVQADTLRAKLQAEQDEKNARQTKQEKQFKDNKFRPELIGAKTQYVVRILPNIFVDEGKSEPWVNTFVHIFFNPNGIKKFVLCPRTPGIGGSKTTPCPLCEKSRELFNKVNDKTASKAEGEMASNLYHKPRYFINVLIVEDPRPAEKNQKGEVLIYETGPQINDKMKEMLLDQKKDFHDPHKGYNLNLIVKKKGVQLNYESSHFTEVSTPVATTDAEFERITNAIHDLGKFCFSKPAKSYDEIKLIIEGKEPQKVEKTWDSKTGITTERVMGRTEIDENAVLPENPVTEQVPVTMPPVTVSTVATPESKPQQFNDEELLKQLDM